MGFFFSFSVGGGLGGICFWVCVCVLYVNGFFDGLLMKVVVVFGVVVLF